MSRKTTLSKWIQPVLGTIFSLAVLGWAAITLDWQQVWTALRTVDPLWVTVAVLTVLLTIAVRGIRWRTLLHPDTPPYFPVFSALLIGQVINGIVPARAGDLARAYLIGRSSGLSKARALGTVGVEKLWDILMLILFTLGVSFFFALPMWLTAPTQILAAALVVAIIGLGLVLWQRERALQVVTWVGRRFLPAVIQARIEGISRNFLDGFTGLYNARLLTLAGLWSLGVWLLGGLTNYALFFAFDLQLPLVAAFFLLVVLQAGVAIPTIPGRIGVFEGICVVVLAFFDVPYAVAFSYGVVLHLVVFIPPIVLAAILAWRLNLYDDPQLAAIRRADTPLPTPER